ncbi:MAG: response regulator [Candidatus Pacebacteria bacterium]|nr:response regulator [Candidatus Paceibacterota bacterium]
MKILVVDDDDSLRKAQERLFKAHGHEVITAPDPVMAMVELGNCGGVDLVITDLNMPAPNSRSYNEGLQLITDIRKTFPEQKIILVSGDMTDQIAVQATALGAEVGLPKTALFGYLRETGVMN